jgi:hypothetical protein
MAMEFEQLPRETNKAFAAFRAYLDMGPERSLAAVGAKLGKSKVMMEKWSRKYDWCARVAAHAAHVAEQERLAIESMVREKSVEWGKVWEEQRISEWRARNRLVALANRLVDRWEKNENRTGTPEGIARLFELASKLGRSASKMPEERGMVTGEIKGTLEVEWEVALKKVYGKHHEIHEPREKVIEAEILDETHGTAGTSGKSQIADKQGGGEV